MLGVDGEFPSVGDFLFVERVSHFDNTSRENSLGEYDISLFCIGT